MAILNPTVAQRVLLPIDGTADQPSLRIGGTLAGHEGTGLYGSMASVALSVAGSQVLEATASGVTITGSLTSTAPLILTTMTEAARDALTPVAGMIILNTDTSAVNVYDGSDWVELAVAP